MSNKALNHVWEHSKQRGSALVLMLAIADMANDEGECFPGNTNLAKKCRCSVRNLQKLVDKCEIDGELWVVENGGTKTKNGWTNRYIVSGVSKRTAEEMNARTPLVRGGVNSDVSSNVNSDVSRDVSVDVESLSEPQEEPSEKERTKESADADAALFDTQIQETEIVDTDVSPVEETVELPIKVQLEPAAAAEPAAPADAVPPARKVSYQEAVRYTWELAAPAPGKKGVENQYAGLLSGKGQKDSEWEKYALEEPATTAEIVGFGRWYRRTMTANFPTTPKTIQRQFGLFRQHPDYQKYLERAESIIQEFAQTGIWQPLPKPQATTGQPTKTQTASTERVYAHPSHMPIAKSSRLDEDADGEDDELDRMLNELVDAKTAGRRVNEAAYVPA